MATPKYLDYLADLDDERLVTELTIFRRNPDRLPWIDNEIAIRLEMWIASDPVDVAKEVAEARARIHKRDLQRGGTL